MVDYSAVNARQDACDAQSLRGSVCIKATTDILKQISTAAGKGKFSATFSSPAFFEPIVLNRLRLLGYKVQMYYDQRDGDYLEVTW